MKKFYKSCFCVAIILIFCFFSFLPTFAYTQGYDGMGPVVISGGKRDFKWPVPGYYNIQSCFYDTRNHCAIDISAPLNTPAVASYAGTVIKAVDGGANYYGDGFGNFVVLQHTYQSSNGTITLYSRYSHLNSVSVREGAIVSAGAEVGKIGTTGSSTGYHLDFQILYGSWKPYQTYSIDPYANQLLELPTNTVVYDSWACGTSYLALVKDLYLQPIVSEPTSIIYPTSGSIYKIASGIGNKMYLDFAASNNNVQIYENCDGHKDSAYIKSQYYKLTHVGDGWYSIVNIGNGKAVDVYDWRTASGTNIQQWDLHGGDCQLFRFYDAGNGYCYIKSKLGCYVDVQNAENANNANVWTYSFNGTNAQKWKLEKHSHSYSSKVTTPATCTKSGVKTYTCSKCKDSYTEKISTSGNHTYGGWTVTKNASCTENGSQQRKCSKCGNVQNEKIAATGHNYQSKTIAANCKDYEKIQYTCKNCNHTYEEYTKDKFSEWSTSKPSGIDENLIERKTQYRYSDYVTKTSYETSMSGYTKISNTWENTGSGTVQYVKSWPSGFNKAHGLYATYNKSPKSKSETSTNKTVINGEQIVGYLYYHWCRGTYTAGPINRTTKDVQTGEFSAFHAFYSTTAPTGLTAASDGSYVHGNGNCCKDSHWYYCVAVYKQSYTIYRNLYKYEKWTSWTDWSDKEYTSTSTRKVETRTLYRYSNNQIGNHSYENGKCIYCGSVDVGVVKMGDVDTNGKISASDARLVLRTSVGLETLTESLIVVADVNKDNKISAADARLILRASVGLEDASSWN